MPIRRGMTRPLRRTAVAALCALALAGCVGSYEKAADDTAARFIGMHGRALRKCLGVPTDFDKDGDREVMIYRWVDKPRQQGAAIGSGGVGGIVLGRGGAAGGGDPMGLPPDPNEIAF